MTKDLLTGNPIKRILSFCVPLLIGNLFQQFYNMADSVIVGKFMGTNAFAAVGSTGSLNFLIIGFVLGVCSGFAIPVAQDFGARDMKGVKRNIANTVYLGTAVTVVLTVAMFFGTHWILSLVQTPAELMQDAYDYIFIIFMGMGAIMLYNVLACILRAVGDSKTPLYFLIISCILNILLDLLFIPVLHIGVAGAAYATVIAQVVSGVLCLIYMHKKFPHLHLEKEDWKLSWEHIARLAHCGIPMGLQFSITAVGSVILQSAVNGLGTTAVAAVSAANKVQNITSAPLDSMGAAAATYCGQNIGAKQVDRVRKGIKQMMWSGLCYCVIAFFLNAYVGRYIALLFIDNSETQVMALLQQFLVANGAFYPMLLVIFVFRNSIQGLGYSNPAMMAGLFEMVARVVVAFGFVSQYGFTAVCFASPAAWVAADVLLLALYAHIMHKLVLWDNARKRAEQMHSTLIA